jgi:hypothetical protein
VEACEAVILPKDLVNAFALNFQKIPPLLAVLVDGANSVVPYIDVNPQNNSWEKARYQMAQGSLLVVYHGFILEKGAHMEAWQHLVTVYLKAQKGMSLLDLIPLLMNGVPVPGDGLRWHYCELLPGLLPPHVDNCHRETDSEGIDYFQVVTSNQETGDN